MSQGYRVTMQSMEWKGLLVTQLCQVSVPVSMQFCWVECLSFPCKPRQSFKTLQYFPAPLKQPRKNYSHPPHPQQTSIALPQTFSSSGFSARPSSPLSPLSWGSACVHVSAQAELLEAFMNILCTTPFLSLT